MATKVNAHRVENGIRNARGAAAARVSLFCRAATVSLAVALAAGWAGCAVESSGSAGTGGTGGNKATGGSGSGGSSAASGGGTGTASGGSGTGGASNSGGSSGSSGGVSGGSGGTASGGASGTGGQSPGSGGSSGRGGSSASGGAAAGTGGGLAGTGGAGGATVGPTETLHYSGRWNIQTGGRATTVSSGSYVNAQFTGTEITGRFDVSVNDKSDMPTVAWRVDGATTWKVAEVAATLSMGTGLTAGTHTITVIARGLDENKNRWSPPLTSSITFLGFTVTGGSVEATPRPAQPKLEILGDSITEGVVVQGSAYMGNSGQCWKNDAVYSYPTQTGMMLNADYRQVGFGYQGLLKGGNGGVPAANESFKWIYKDVPRDSWQPDMVVINQGTNDGSQPASTFKSAYMTFLSTIRAAYPNARIVALRPFNGAQAAQIQSAVTAANDVRMHYVDTTGWLSSGDYSDGLHPNVQGSGKAATALVAAIKKIGFP